MIGFNPYYLGWDRSGNSGTGGVGIHHPKGDVKKIATLNHTPNNGWNGKSMYWSFYWDATPNGYSVTEGGSSGSPLINNNRHIIGQLYGESENDCKEPSQDIAVYGKFSFSWNGDPTSNSRKRRLRDWLDPANINPQTWNGIGVINASPSISGPTVVCNQGTYTIQDLPSGTSIQWSTSNGNLQLISGQGTRTAVSRKNGTGRCTIKAALRSANLNITPTLDVWAGVPKTTVSTSAYKNVTSATVELILNNPATIIDNMVSFSAQGTKVDPRNWVLKNHNENIFGLNRNGEHITIIPRQEGSGIFSMTALNNCGTGSPAYVTVNVVKRKLHLSLFPNPATDVVTLKLTESDDGILSPQGQGSLATRGVTNTYEIQLWNGLTILKSFKPNQPTFQIPIAGLPAGLYFVRVIKDGQTYTEKLIKN